MFLENYKFSSKTNTLNFNFPGSLIFLKPLFSRKYIGDIKYILILDFDEKTF